MGLGRYMVDGWCSRGANPNELARAHGISQSWIYKLVDRFRRASYPALEPKSRRPHSSPRQVSPEVQAAVVELRHELFVAAMTPAPRPSFITWSAGSTRFPPSPPSGAS